MQRLNTSNLNHSRGVVDICMAQRIPLLCTLISHLLPLLIPICPPAMPLLRQLTQHSLPQAPEVHVGRLEGLFPLLVQGELLAFDQNGGAALQDPLWGPLHHQQVAQVKGVIQLMY